MKRPLRPYALIALATVVVGTLENVFFGEDEGGLKHQISLGFFFLTVAGVPALIALVVVALVRRFRSSAAS